MTVAEQRSNNAPFATIDLTEEEHAFLLENCDVNIEQGLMFMQRTTAKQRGAAEVLVVVLEKFKDIRNKLLSASR